MPTSSWVVGPFPGCSVRLWVVWIIGSSLVSSALIFSQSVVCPVVLPGQTAGRHLRLGMGESDDLESSGVLLLWFPPVAASKLCEGEKRDRSVKGSPCSCCRLWRCCPRALTIAALLGKTEVTAADQTHKWIPRGLYKWTGRRFGGDELIRNRGLSSTTAAYPPPTSQLCCRVHMR